MRRRDPQAGRIPLPPVEIVELDARLDGAAVGKPVALRPRSGWLGRVLSADASRFVLGPEQVPAELLGDRAELALLEIAGDGRPVLEVVPGMAGDKN